MRAAVLAVCVLPLISNRADGGIASGFVVDDSGAGVAEARVVLRRPGQSVAAVSHTGPDGRFRMNDVEPDTYELIVSKHSFAPRSMALSVGRGPLDVMVRISVQPISTQVTVTAEAGRVEAADRIAQRVNVISRSELDERTGTVVTDVLREEAGVEVQRTGPVMGGAMIRGLLGKNIAVYKDGVRYTTSAQRGGVSTFFNSHESSALEAVEVLRGPNSAQYSSDSIGGTVHFLSRELGSGPGWHGEFAPVYVSSAHAFGASVFGSYSKDRFGMSTSLNANRVNTLRAGQRIDTHAAVTRFLGLPSTVLGERLQDTAFTRYGGMVRGQYTPTADQQIIVHYERNQQDGGKRTDQLLGGDGNLIAELRNLMLDFGYVRYTHYQPGWLDQVAGTLSYNAQREQRVNQGGNGNPMGAITSQYERTAVWGASVYAAKKVRDHSLLVGGDGYRERMRSPAFTFSPANGSVIASRPRVPDGALYLLHGVYAQDVWQPVNRLRVSGAARYGGASYRSRAAHSPLVGGVPLWPDDSAAANAFSGRAGAVLKISGALRLHANYGRGFRAPSMTDLGTIGIQGNGFYEASATDLAGRRATVGNRADDLAVSSGRSVAQVRAETSDNIEGGLEVATHRVSAEFTVFRIGLNDTIVSQTLILPQGAVGQMLGDQTITRQLASGAVFVPAATAPVLIRSNIGEASIRGLEHSMEVRLTRRLSFAENLTWLYARDGSTGLAPDIEGGTPPITSNLRVRWARSTGLWLEAYTLVAGSQERLSSLALADRRTGASRSRSNIANFFHNGARVRGLVQNGVLVPTGEVLSEVQQRVLATANSAPMFTAVPGYVLAGVRGGARVSERSDVLFDVSNLLDQSHRGVSWGVDGAGRGITVRYRYRF